MGALHHLFSEAAKGIGTSLLAHSLTLCISLLFSVERLLKSSSVQKAALSEGGSVVGESQRMEQTGQGFPDKVSLHIAATGNKISSLYLQGIFCHSSARCLPAGHQGYRLGSRHALFSN